MGLFDNVKNSQNLRAEKDTVRGAGRGVVPSGLYKFLVKYCYGQKSKGGALGINLVLTSPDHGDREFKFTEWVTSGDEKGNKTFYESDGEEIALPGYVTIEALFALTLGVSVQNANNEKRTIPIYNFDQKAEVPTEVDMYVDILGKPVNALILQTRENKQKRNDQGVYEDVPGETRDINEIEKFLDPETNKTAIELGNNIEADFHEKWLTKWEGEVNDKSSAGASSSGNAGAPAASAGTTTKSGLFGGN